MNERFARAFPFWVSLASGLALVFPALFTWFITGKLELSSGTVVLSETGLVTPGLQLIMLSMGLTLRFEDFRAVRTQRGAVVLGLVLQFTVMPSLGFLLARAFGLSDALAAGLVLVCCCPGGTASNVIAFLAKADVALSVAMTACSTLLAALLTPTLSALLIGTRVNIDVATLYLATLNVVLLPVILGVVLRRYGERLIRPILPVLPSLAVIAIVLIVAGIIGVQKEKILSQGFSLLLAVVCTHGLAFLAGYLIARSRGESESAARTISIEVGMQNSGLGVVLARASFPDPLVAVTPAISAVIHCLYGSAVAAIWSRSEISDAEDDSQRDSVSHSEE